MSPQIIANLNFYWNLGFREKYIRQFFKLYRVWNTSGYNVTSSSARPTSITWRAAYRNASLTKLHKTLSRVAVLQMKWSVYELIKFVHGLNALSRQEGHAAADPFFKASQACRGPQLQRLSLSGLDFSAGLGSLPTDWSFSPSLPVVCVPSGSAAVWWSSRTFWGLAECCTPGPLCWWSRHSRS